MSVHGPLGATPRSGSFELTTAGYDARSSAPSSRLGLLALAGLIVTGLLITLAAAGTDTLLPESVRPVPASLAGPFGSTGLDLGVVGVVAVLSVMFASYVVAVQHAGKLSARAVLACIAALHAVVLLGPPLISTDVFSYIGYGRMGALYGISPYFHGPHAIAFDPVFPFIGAKWFNIPTVYGPVFTALSYALAPLSIAVSALIYKALAAIASLGTIALVWNAARLRGLDPVKAVALVGLNPLIVVYGVGGGHNDLLMLVVMMTGVYLLLSHRGRGAGATIALAAGIKLTAGLMLPFAAASQASGQPGRRRRDVLIGAAVVAALLLIGSVALFGGGPLKMIATLKQAQDEGDWRSIPNFITSRLGLGLTGHVAGLLLGVTFLGVLCRLVWNVWRGRLDWIDGAAWATVAMLVTATSLLPWYIAWLIPLAALAGDRRLTRVSIVLTGVILFILLIGYIPNANSVLGL